MAPHGLVQGNLTWHGPVRGFIREFKMTSHGLASNLRGKTLCCIRVKAFKVKWPHKCMHTLNSIQRNTTRHNTCSQATTYSQHNIAGTVVSASRMVVLGNCLSMLVLTTASTPAAAVAADTTTTTTINNNNNLLFRKY